MISRKGTLCEGTTEFAVGISCKIFILADRTHDHDHRYRRDHYHCIFDLSPLCMDQKYKSLGTVSRNHCDICVCNTGGNIPNEYDFMDCGESNQRRNHCVGGCISARASSDLFSWDLEHAVRRFDDRTINELVKGTFEMAKVKTGALIVVEKDFQLKEYERTGIALDSLVSSQLLINIFEKNTPLHDGAIIVRGNRVVSATCDIPLSDNMELDKGLGTRHRAAVGISEVSDSMTIIVSEETGAVSVAEGGRILRALDEQKLRELLMGLQKAQYGENKMQRLKRRLTHAAENSEDSRQ